MKPNWKHTGYIGDWVITKDNQGNKVLWVWTGEDWANNKTIFQIEIRA